MTKRCPDATHARYTLLVVSYTTTYEFVSVTARAGGSAIARRPRSTYLSWTGLPMAMARWLGSSGDGPTYGLKGGPAIRREAPSNAKSSRHSAMPLCSFISSVQFRESIFLFQFKISNQSLSCLIFVLSAGL